MLLHARGAQASALELELRAPGLPRHRPLRRLPARRRRSRRGRRLPGAAARRRRQLCVRNTGRRAVGLVGTDEPLSVSLPATDVDGKPTGEVDPAITFLAGPPQSIISRAGTILGRASDFTGGFVPLWLLWPLTIAVRARRPAGPGMGALQLARARGATPRP